MSYLGSDSEEEGRAILNKMQFLKDDTIAKSKSSTGYLDAIKNGAYFDMWQNLNPRKDGLDHEALTIWQAFEAIDPVTPDVLITIILLIL